MINQDKNVRITITVSKDMANKLNVISEQLGVSRSQFCAVAVGNYVASQSNAMEILQKVVRDALNEKTDKALDGQLTIDQLALAEALAKRS